MRLLHHVSSRRGFLRGAAATGAGALAVSALSSCSSSTDTDQTTPTVVDSGSATYVVGSGSIEGSYQEASADNGGTTGLTELGAWDLPLGCVLRPAEGSWRPYVTPVVGSSHMTAAGVASVSSGATLTLIDSPQAGGNYVVYDARCSDTVFAWSELDLVTRDWKLFAAPLGDNGELATISTLWEGDANYDPPFLCCTASSVIWLVMPAVSGERTTENSSCYLWQVGGTSADEVVRSAGRFACAPSISDGMLTLTPRVRTRESGKYYGITAYDIASNLTTVSAQLVLPQSVQPFSAVRMGDVFAFSIEANYGSGGLLGSMGTYIGNGDDPFIALPREPAATVTGKNGVYLVKTRASHLIVDTNAQTYATLVAPNRALDYGDYPASEGTSSSFVTFATVQDMDTGYPKAVVMRTFSL